MSMNKRKFAIFGRDKERTTLKLQAETACLYHYEPAVKGKMVLEDVGSTWTDPHVQLCVLGIAKRTFPRPSSPRLRPSSTFNFLAIKLMIIHTYPLVI